MEIWAAERSFSEAQEEGQIPYDEPFCYFSVMSVGSEGKWTWAYSIDSSARALMADAAREELADTWVPEERHNGWSHDGMPMVEAYATFPLKNGRYVFGHAKPKNFGYFGGITATELVSDLAVADLGDQLRQVMVESARRGRERASMRSTQELAIGVAKARSSVLTR